MQNQRTIRAILGAVLLAPLGRAQPQRKVYVDKTNGVSFAYPASWLLNGDDDAATAKLRTTVVAQPNAVVQLEGDFAEGGPYEGTDFESGAFSYVIATGGTEGECFAVLDRSAEVSRMPVPILWNGLKARRLDSTYTVAGTDDIHHIVATFRNARCYLFETVLIRKSADAVPHPLPPSRWRQLQAAFDAVLNSVRITVPVKD